MAENVDYLLAAQKIVRGLCQPNGCIYARTDGCEVKYSDEVVVDAAAGACYSAAKDLNFT